MRMQQRTAKETSDKDSDATAEMTAFPVDDGDSDQVPDPEAWHRALCAAYQTAGRRRTIDWAVVLGANAIYDLFGPYVLVGPAALLGVLLGDHWLWLFVVVMPATLLPLRQLPEPTFQWFRDLGFEDWDKRMNLLLEELDRVEAILESRVRVTQVGGRP
jgi:hypothetical protein